MPARKRSYVPFRKTLMRPASAATVLADRRTMVRGARLTRHRPPRARCRNIESRPPRRARADLINYSDADQAELVPAPSTIAPTRSTACARALSGQSRPLQCRRTAMSRFTAAMTAPSGQSIPFAARIFGHCANASTPTGRRREPRATATHCWRGVRLAPLPAPRPVPPQMARKPGNSRTRHRR